MNLSNGSKINSEIWDAYNPGEQVKALKSQDMRYAGILKENREQWNESELVRENVAKGEAPEYYEKQYAFRNTSENETYAIQDELADLVQVRKPRKHVNEQFLNGNFGMTQKILEENYMGSDEVGAALGAEDREIDNILDEYTNEHTDSETYDQVFNMVKHGSITDAVDMLLDKGYIKADVADPSDVANELEQQLKRISGDEYRDNEQFNERVDENSSLEELEAEMKRLMEEWRYYTGPVGQVMDARFDEYFRKEHERLKTLIGQAKSREFAQGQFHEAKISKTKQKFFRESADDSKENEVVLAITDFTNDHLTSTALSSSVSDILEGRPPSDVVDDLSSHEFIDGHKLAQQLQDELERIMMDGSANPDDPEMHSRIARRETEAAVKRFNEPNPGKVRPRAPLNESYDPMDVYFDRDYRFKK